MITQRDIPEHFKTHNVALVAAAKLIGVRWVQGLPAIIRHFSRGYLNSIGFPTMEEAMAAGKLGNPEYVLEETEEFRRFRKAWDDARERIAKEGEAATVVLPNCTIEEAAELLAFFSTKKGDILKEVRALPGTMTEENGGTASERGTKDGGKKVTAPGFKIHTSNLNDADRKRLKIQ